MDLPLAAALMVAPTKTDRLRRTMRALPLLAAGLAGAVGGQWLSLQNPANSAYFGRIVKPMEAMLNLAAFVGANFGDPWFMAMSLLVIATVIVGLVTVLSRARSNPVQRAVWMYVLVAIADALVFPVVSGRFVAPDQWRYLAVIPILALTAFLPDGGTVSSCSA